MAFQVYAFKSCSATKLQQRKHKSFEGDRVSLVPEFSQPYFRGHPQVASLQWRSIALIDALALSDALIVLSSLTFSYVFSCDAGGML